MVVDGWEVVVVGGGVVMVMQPTDGVHREVKHDPLMITSPHNFTIFSSNFFSSTIVFLFYR